ncbi:MAG: GGDEF domain-containing protein [Rhodoferax sp.]|nr:GGDEF domain-containing protein [Rhodoferax sp.]
MSSPTLDRVLDAVFRVDRTFDVKFISEPGKHWLEVAPDAGLPKNFVELLHPADLEQFKSACKTTPDFFSCDVRLIKGVGECWVNLRAYRLTAVDQYVLCVIDISAWRRDESVYRLATEHDELTGLASRSAFKNAVEIQLRSGVPTFFVFLLDLDGFKNVNDALGHAEGDAVLIETAKRLRSVVGPESALTRLGGDEFVLLLNGASVEAAKEVAKTLLQAVARPYDTHPHDTYLGASIGIARFPGHGADYGSLLKNADNAMHQAKRMATSRVCIFSAAQDNTDFSIRAAVHKAIHEGEFYLEYQPQFDINRQLVGAEALMRWFSSDYGQVSPVKFIPIVEEAGLMPFLGQWALRYACHQLKQFHALMPNFVMSVNVSPVQFGGDGFDQHVLDAIAETGVDSTKVILEITESTLMQSQERTELALTKLCNHGIRFSIDDFGTGFSSLAYLTRLPVSSIKIDKAFVSAMENLPSASSTNRKLVTAMISLAHSIDLSVVAEGVETETEFDFLRQSGCNLIQGYLLSRPISAATVLQLMKQSGAVAT